MEAVLSRVKALRPVLEEITSLSGTAGVSYGIIYRGEVIFTSNIGYRDVENKIPVNDETIFQVGSLTKAMVAAEIGMMVEEKLMDWDTPLRDVLPEWHVQDPSVRANVTIIDCLAHRTGLQMNNYWLASNNNIIIPLKDSMKVLNALRPVLPFRGQFQYNNLGYEVAGHVIHKITGKTWDEMLRQRLLSPLGLHRTGSHAGFAGTDNVSKCYGALSNGTPVHIGDAQIGDNTIAGAAGGVRSCLKDMISLAKVYLDAAEHQLQPDKTSSAGSPLKQMNCIMSEHVSTGSSPSMDTSYGLGWARTQLPGPLGMIGLNNFWLRGEPGQKDGFPIVGKSSEPELVIYHQGSNPGVLAAYNLIPRQKAAVVVLSNTLALVDAADWMGQALVEAVLDVKDRNDYTQITKDTIAKALSWYSPVAKVLKENVDLRFPRDAIEYVGVFQNAPGTVHIDIVYEENQLKLVFQGLPDEKWNLYPWKGDTLTWLPESRDVLASRGRFSFQSPDYYKIKFSVAENGEVKTLNWVHEGWNVPEGEDFYKI